MFSLNTVLSTNICHRRVILHSCNWVKSWGVRRLYIAHVVTRHALCSRLMGTLTDDVLERVPIIHGLEHDTIVAYASLMLIEFLTVKVVALNTSETELILAVKDEVLVIVQLVLQSLDLYTHPRPPLDFPALFLSTCEHRINALLLPSRMNLLFHRFVRGRLVPRPGGKRAIHRLVELDFNVAGLLK